MAQLHAFAQRRVHFEEAGAQGIGQRTQFLAVERLGNHRARGLAAAGKLVIIVRPEGVAALQFYPLFDQEIDHPGRLVDIGLPLFTGRSGRIAAVQLLQGIKVSQPGLGAVRLAIGAQEAVVGDPHDPAGLGRGATEVLGLFQHDDGLARLAHDQRRGHRACPAADHYPVERLVKSGHPPKSPVPAFGAIKP